MSKKAISGMVINLFLVQHCVGDILERNYIIIAPSTSEALKIAFQLNHRAYGAFYCSGNSGLSSYHITHLRHFKALRRDDAKRLQWEAEMRQKYYLKSLCKKHN
jgi:hypothetical protein